MRKIQHNKVDVDELKALQAILEEELATKFKVVSKERAAFVRRINALKGAIDV